MARSWASSTAAWTWRARALGVPIETVRVRSTQYESYTPPKSSTTRSPSVNVRPPGRACGKAALGPLATIVSKAGRSNPAWWMRQSIASATSRSVRPRRTSSKTPLATADSRRAASRSVSSSYGSLRTRWRSTIPSVGTSSGGAAAAFRSVAVSHVCRPTVRCAASNPIRLAFNDVNRAASAASYEPSTLISSSPGHACLVARVSSSAVT